MTFEQDLPVGKVIFFVSLRKVVHIVDTVNDVMLTNQVIYPCEIQNYLGQKGHIKQGYTFAVGVADNLTHKIVSQENILIGPTLKMYYVHTGERVAS